MNKVVVIEDNADNMRLITYALRHAGYEVVEAWTGEEGVELVMRERPFFVVVDLKLPGIDGLEATRLIRESEGDDRIPIVAITSFAMAGDREKVLQAGCTAYFEKPIDPLTIVERIHAAIGVAGACAKGET
jgi:two-component system, cell cycle response regulator DivK